MPFQELTTNPALPLSGPIPSGDASPPKLTFMVPVILEKVRTFPCAAEKENDAGGDPPPPPEGSGVLSGDRCPAPKMLNCAPTSRDAASVRSVAASRANPIINCGLDENLRRPFWRL